MKESTWVECIENNCAITITPNKAKARSLTDTAFGRIGQYLKETTIKESNANYVFEGYYSSVLEMLHTVVLLKGYNVQNHICLGYYLRDLLKKDVLFRMFDDCRYKRNSLVYYGRKMDFETAKIAIGKCLNLIKEIGLLLKEKK